MNGVSRIKIKPILRVLLALGAISPVALSQVSSNTPAISLTATLPESVAISAPTTATWTALTPGASTNADASLSIVTSWVLATSRSSVELDAYFASATQALHNGTHYIPSSAVFGLVSTGTPTTATAFTGSPALGTAGAGLQLFTQTISVGNANFSSSRTDSLVLSIDLTGVPVPAAIYTGTLTLAAQAL